MGEEFTYDVDNALMRVRAWGPDPINDWYTSKVEVMKLHEERGANRLLVDVREQEESPPLFEILDFGDVWPATIRVAILAGRNTPEDMLIMETAARHRGKQIRVFFDETEALGWLDEASE
jgi:hypothetical protein